MCVRDDGGSVGVGFGVLILWFFVIMCLEEVVGS